MYFVYIWPNCDLLSAIHKQRLKKYIYYVNQSEPLNRFWMDYMSKVCYFCYFNACVSPETSLAAGMDGSIHRLLWDCIYALLLVGKTRTNTFPLSSTIILITTIISCSSSFFKCNTFTLPYPCQLLELVLCHLVLVMVILYSFLILVEHLWAQQHGWVLTVQAAKKWYKTLLIFFFFCAKDLSGSFDALWCWIILKSPFSASLIACDGVLHVHSEMSVTQHLCGLPGPLLPGARPCMMMLLYILHLFSDDTQKHVRIVRRKSEWEFFLSAFINYCLPWPIFFRGFHS